MKMQTEIKRTVMRMGLGLILIGWFIPSVWALPRPQKMDEEKLAEQRYQAAMKESLERAQKLAQKTKAPSLVLTAEAGNLLLLNRNNSAAFHQIREAVEIDPENLLARLLYADLLSLKQSFPEAEAEYNQFLKTLEKPGDPNLRNSLFKMNDLLPVVTHISARLKTQGKKSFDAKTFYHRLFWHNFSLRVRWFLENMIPYGLAVVVLMGIPFFLFRRLTDMEASIPTERMLFQIYCAMIAGYALWMAHTFLNLPVLFEPMELEVVLVIVPGTILAILFRIQIYRQERKAERQDPYTQPCPACGKIIIKLAVICPHCNRKI